MEMFEDLEEDINKCLNENTQFNEILKTIQVLKF